MGYGAPRDPSQIIISKAAAVEFAALLMSASANISNATLAMTEDEVLPLVEPDIDISQSISTLSDSAAERGMGKESLFNLAQE